MQANLSNSNSNSAASSFSIGASPSKKRCAGKYNNGFPCQYAAGLFSKLCGRCEAKLDRDPQKIQTLLIREQTKKARRVAKAVHDQSLMNDAQTYMLQINKEMRDTGSQLLVQRQAFTAIQQKFMCEMSEIDKGFGLLRAPFPDTLLP